MIKISARQYSAFAAIPKAEFLRSITAFLREQFDDAREMPNGQLQAAASQCMARAESYGITNGQDVATFVVTAYLLGPDFDREFPAATNVLLSPVLASADKVEWLREWTEELFQAFEGGN